MGEIIAPMASVTWAVLARYTAPNTPFPVS